MKRINYIAWLTVISLLFSCIKEKDKQQPSVEADFEASIVGQAPSATLVLKNNSVEAETYSWTFSEGTSISSSTDKEPSNIILDKAGEVTITLNALKGSDKKSKTVTIQVPGHSAIITYSDLEFAQNSADPTYGRFFSSITGKMYKDVEVNATTGSQIDLGFFGCLCTAIFFYSPDWENSDLKIPGATKTLIKNYESGFNPVNFDVMSDDSKLKPMTIIDDNEAIGSWKFPLVVLFQNSLGKKGAIKLKSISKNRLLVDIKIQKYKNQ